MTTSALEAGASTVNRGVRSIKAVARAATVAATPRTPAEAAQRKARVAVVFRFLFVLAACACGVGAAYVTFGLGAALLAACAAFLVLEFTVARQETT